MGDDVRRATLDDEGTGRGCGDVLLLAAVDNIELFMFY
jgi:hypothetical protein